jgi:hypothetical protein
MWHIRTQHPLSLTVVAEIKHIIVVIAIVIVVLKILALHPRVKATQLQLEHLTA